MTWTKVKSSNVAQVAHDPKQNVLGVRYHNGGEYHYANVPAEKHAAMLGAESVGSYLNTHIVKAKDAKGKPLHPHTKIK